MEAGDTLEEKPKEVVIDIEESGPHDVVLDRSCDAPTFEMELKMRFGSYIQAERSGANCVQLMRLRSFICNELIHFVREKGGVFLEKANGYKKFRQVHHEEESMYLHEKITTIFFRYYDSIAKGLSQLHP